MEYKSLDDDALPHRYYYGVSYYGDRAERCAGVFYGGNPAGSFKAAWVCVAVIIAWTGSTMTVLFGAMKATGILRVSSEVEDAGMDDSKHGGAHSCVPASET